ncbi:MAG: Lysine-tRNA ligase [Candidatus Woesebacteria bacterium GW2011_GWB1_38_5b]|uniref:Lysine--tRNA ligase n=1 Tax=Candidatus Woesebacteria bacterium GW2011_GWB1_38_5b TaxID=1618569 RepID=A0A0G0K7I5_9BACT|nr:MAG: Lysine-tRNA ligase [Candidatus Woesebacteria bacterium GW2011_GWB1_38_5b]OGH47208.1 MAG: lysine--tRNA ligase [Candidatus Levybacteria bacterium RIFCSPLOWO2_01_FULL_39_10]
MFWADKVASEIIDSGRYTPYWVDDMKTPSGRVHIGALRGLVVHDLVYKALIDRGKDAKYTYVFDNHDPMDDIPTYLPREKFEKYLGMPLFSIPSPEPGFDNYAEFYAKEFEKVFRAIGCEPEIIWAKDLYTKGLMNGVIKEVLDNSAEVRKIYEEMYDKKLTDNWYPFQLFCPECGKVSTTNVTGWDGKEVTYECLPDKVPFTKGCGAKGKVSPFSTKDKMAGKLPWKVEWACKWKVIGITVEGAGKDHMSKGGSHDLASEICKRVINYPVPYAVSYEWFLIGGRKMSSSKGVGTSAIDMLEILPPELIRFLMVRIKVNTQINFDPTEPATIPNLFDDYQKASEAYFEKSNEDLARVFELSQIGEIKKPPLVRFSILTQWVQMPNVEEEIKKQGLGEWVKYAKVWVERFAPEDQKFEIQKGLPDASKDLTDMQKKVLGKISDELDKKWNGEDFQVRIYDIGKELGLTGKETFQAIYQTLLGKDHGPKAGFLILSLDKEFVKKRFQDASK